MCAHVTLAARAGLLQRYPIILEHCNNMEFSWMVMEHYNRGCAKKYSYGWRILAKWYPYDHDNIVNSGQCLITEVLHN